VDQLYEKAIPTQVPKTCQTASYSNHNDGYNQKGVPWPNLRFACYDSDHAGVDCAEADAIVVTDNLTGLMWTKNANLDGLKNWATALSYCNDLDYGGYRDWRLPNAKELFSLIDMGRTCPALPSGHPFVNIQPSYSWYSTPSGSGSAYAWRVDPMAGYVYITGMASTDYVWPACAGQ